MMNKLISFNDSSYNVLFPALVTELVLNARTSIDNID